jgi:HEAT repeat protein
MKGRESLLRESAVQGLWRSRSPRAVAPLIKALSDRAADVRYKAVQAICGFGDERALEPLKKMLAAKSNGCDYPIGLTQSS